MIQPTQGPSAGPVLLAAAALVAAGASHRAGGGSVREIGSSPSLSERQRSRSCQAESAQSDATNYERVEGPVRTLAPAGDPSGDDVGSSSALCPSGMRVVSGGYQTITGWWRDLLQRRPHKWSSWLGRRRGKHPRHTRNGAGLCVLR